MRRFTHRDEGFTCGRCGLGVAPLGRAGCRNHCPRCLTSRHVDGGGPGDRASDCGALMTAVAARTEARRGIVLEHRCDTCGTVRVNKLAVSRPGVTQPDDMEAVIALMSRAADGG